MTDSDKLKALKMRLARGYISQIEDTINLRRLRNIHQLASQVLVDGPEFNLVVEAIVERAKFLGYSGDLGELYA